LEIADTRIDFGKGDFDGDIFPEYQDLMVINLELVEKERQGFRFETYKRITN